MSNESINKKEHYHINYKNISKKHVLYSLIIVILILSVYNLINIDEMQKYANDKLIKIRGLNNQTLPSVNLIIIKDKNCKECIDMDIAISEFKTLEVNFGDEKVYEFDEATEIINKYNIGKIPALILSPEASNYKVITNVWANVGTVESDGYFVLRNINPPYLELKDNKIKGLVSLTMLYDENCKECYDVTRHKLAIAKVRMYIKDEKKLDINSDEGKKLIEKYKIGKIPTILLSEEAFDYPQFDLIWGGIGDTADDGTLVFRNVETMGTYRDLKTNKIINI